MAQKCQSGFSCKVPGFSSAVCVCVWVEVGSSGSPRSDAGELVPEAGWQDALHLLHDEVERSEQRAEELQDTQERLLQESPGLHLCVETVTTEPRWGGGVAVGGSERFPPSDERACGERRVCVCALISTCMDPSWPHTSYHRASLLLLQRALQSQTCVFEVCVCVRGWQGGTPSHGPHCDQIPARP